MHDKKFKLLFLLLSTTTAFSGEPAPNAPTWIRTPKLDPNFIYSMGEARDIESKEDALERAWISSLLRVGMTQFPELASIRSESTETLHDANYRRQFAMRMDGISWAGIREAEDQGSPYIEFNEETSRYTVYRLLRWSKADIAASRKLIPKKQKHQIPESPENQRKSEDDIITEVRQVHALNAKLENRDAFVGRILNQVRCGTTIEDLREILGSPDREGAVNKNQFYPKSEFYWGTYQVVSMRVETTIFSIGKNNGEGRLRYICN